MKTFSGNRGLLQDEPLIFELATSDGSGVDFDLSDNSALQQNCLAGIESDELLDLPGLSEPETIRHYTRLSQLNYSIDNVFFPLGSCTMKHNPRVNERVARLPGIVDIHPMQPNSTVQGFLEIFHDLGEWLKKLTNMDSIALSPAAGAQGELCGILSIKAALAQQGLEHKNLVLVSDSAHGTNPATSAACGFEVQSIKSAANGLIDLDDFKAKVNDRVAAIMLTNPNTCGLFERDIRQIADIIHEHGGYFYCDGANLNALVGKIKPGDLGIDAMHINLHKTFSTPHGGGGPGSGPTVFSKKLAPFLPLPVVHKNSEGFFELIENTSRSDSGKFTDELNICSWGRIKQFHGQAGLIVRALSYILSHGLNGLREATEQAVLNANYLLAQLKEDFSVPYPGYCMHEVLLSEDKLTEHGLTTLDLAKALIDEGYHPMTIYFPLIVKGAMLIEPTESESKATLDKFCQTMKALAQVGSESNKSRFKDAPVFAPRRRINETKAAREPILNWQDRTK